MKVKSKKLLHLEILRIIAIFFVIFNHTNVNGYLAFTLVPEGSLRWYLYVCISILCKFAVPLFFMISGALLLSKEEPLKIIFKKRVLRTILLIFLAHGFYLFLDIINSNPIDLTIFLKNIYVGGGMEHLWFLYAYLAFIIALPFLRAIAKDLNQQKFLMIFFGVVIVQFVLPIINFVIFKQTNVMNGSITGVWIFSNTVAFPLIGYYLEHRLDAGDAKLVLPLLAICSVGGIILCALLTRYMLSFSDYAEMFFNCPAIFTASLLYIGSKIFFEHRSLPRWLNLWLISMGSAVFGIYVIHPAVTWKSGPAALFMLEHGLSLMTAGLIWVLIIFLISYVLVFVAKKVPILGKLI